MGPTDQDWIGCAVSIACDEVLGVFQGLIKQISAEEITIVRAFRNGVPLRKQNAEVVLKCTDIRSINLIEPVKQDLDGHTAPHPVINKPTPVKLPHFSNILGKQQQLQLQQQQQQRQQFREQDHEQELPSTPRSKTNGYARGPTGAAPSDASAASGSSGSRGNFNSALSDKMHQLKLIETNGPNGTRRTPQTSRASSAQQQPQMSTTPNSVAAFFGNMIPPKVEVKMGAYVANTRESYCSSSGDSGEAAGLSLGSSRPIDIVSNGDGFYKQAAASSYGNTNGNGRRNGNSYNGNGNGNGSYTNGNGNGNGKNKRNRVRRESSMRQQQVQQTFGGEADDPLIHEDFDFEGNLALFNKQAIWDDIESTHQKPDVVRHIVNHHHQPEQKYRHDENILASKPLQLRQIESMFDGSQDFVTDDGLIIPTIPAYVRNKIEMSAEKAGLSLQRQIDILARGASDLAITLLGGARRLTPANNHQWPKIAIICDGVKNMRTINIGAATGRQLASHGLTVLLYVEQAKLMEQNSSSTEISLFKATGNVIVHSVDALPTPDLVILSTNTANLSDAIRKWLSVNRASVLAVDPPPCGINEVAIKYSILPILPLNGISTATASSSSSAAATPTPIASTSAAAAATKSAAATSTNNCGKLYLCNLGIPDKFYRDCGIKYKSPYGHKYVIPIHSKD
ncbi:enhancer of mRNA-decapping protein 3 [Drosophila ficusphila]|uniref:enhancer of mRNA-decapping protein 3 n=1 Tax=Drosophila ficusphila TaxID=30025 RepID=UPI0007E71FDB|nr:enhancer of mRNA-decapping protein 3 [Drosophila ficusphila]